MIMKLSCLQENLHAGLDTVGRAIANRLTLPITQSVLLRTEDGMLTLHGTNLELSVTTRIGAMIEEEGATAVPYQLLNNLVSSLAPDRVDLDLAAPDEESQGLASSSDNMLHIRCSRSVTRINVADPVDFPPLPEVSDEVTLRLDPALLRAAIRMVAPAAATDESRPVLTSIHLKLDGSTLELAAADGFRLAIYQCEVEAQQEEPVAINIPARTMDEVQRLAGRQTGQIVIKMARSSPDNIRFEMERHAGVAAGQRQLPQLPPAGAGQLPDPGRHRTGGVSPRRPDGVGAGQRRLQHRPDRAGPQPRRSDGHHDGVVTLRRGWPSAG